MSTVTPGRNGRPPHVRICFGLCEMLTVAAADLEASLPRQRGDIDFTVADLVVAAWQRFPRRFGMRGLNYPDSKTVSSCLAGKSGPLRRGYLVAAGPGRLRLTPAGHREAGDWLEALGEEKA